MTRVLVMSEVALYREGLAEVIGRRAGMDVVGTAAHSAEALEALAGQAEPTIVVLDIGITDSVEASRRLTATAGVRVLAITVPNREHDVIACAEAGVNGLLTTDASVNDLVGAIESVARGELLCPPSTAAMLLRRVASLARDSARQSPVATLTSRELEIVDLVDRGLSNKQIAQKLCIELPTVKNHVHHILEKLGVRRRAEAAALFRGGAVSRARAEV